MSRSLLMGMVFLAATMCAVFSLSCDALAQNNDARVLWQIDYDAGLSKTERDTVQATLLKVLSRAKERHFAGDSIVTQKINKEGLNFPECFTDGKPCSAGGSLVLDVHNVDAFVKARFSKASSEWLIELDLYQSHSVSAVRIKRGSPNLENLIGNVTGSLFEMESVVEITSQVPDVEVYINEKLVGITPMTLKTSVGHQRVTFKKSGYVPETWEFTAEKGNHLNKEVALVPEKVQLTVLVSDPAATVDINGNAWGRANETHDVLPGQQKIDIHSEAFHDFSMDYKVYAGNPQTVHVALLPKSEDPYAIRHRGISKYRFSVTAGYHLGYQSFSMRNATVDLPSGSYSPPDNNWASTAFHGASLGLNFESKYWGIGIFRLDIGGSGIDSAFRVDDDKITKNYLNAAADGAMFIGFYPAQLKAHYTFWVMQAEAVGGVGLSHLRLKSHIYDTDHWEEGVTFARTAFSLNFDFALKFFFSEESYGMISYDFQYDIEKKNARSFARHGLTVGLGYQLPILVRDDEAPDPEIMTSEEETEVSSDSSSFKLED